MSRGKLTTTSTETGSRPTTDASVTDRQTVPILRRPHSVSGEEAYLRSEREQAAIDIAAGR